MSSQPRLKNEETCLIHSTAFETVNRDNGILELGACEAEVRIRILAA